MLANYRANLTKYTILQLSCIHVASAHGSHGVCKSGKGGENQILKKIVLSFVPSNTAKSQLYVGMGM
jgi:hypothetical protein